MNDVLIRAEEFRRASASFFHSDDSFEEIVELNAHHEAMMIYYFCGEKYEVIIYALLISIAFTRYTKRLFFSADFNL